MKYTIFAPEQSYSGVSASVGFINGRGETDNEHLADWFRGCGYTVEELEAPKRNRKPK